MQIRTRKHFSFEAVPIEVNGHRNSLIIFIYRIYSSNNKRAIGASFCIIRNILIRFLCIDKLYECYLRITLVRPARYVYHLLR